MQQMFIRDMGIAIESIENSLNQLSTLNRLQHIASESEQLSSYSQRLLSITANNAQQCCLESYTVISVEQYTVATETLGDLISNIWEGIKKAFLYIWNALTWLFRSSKVEKLEKEIRMRDELIDEILEKADSNPKFDTEKNISDYSILDAFQYLNETTITETVIIERLKSTEPVMKNIQELFNYCSGFSKLVRDIIRNHSKGTFNEADSKEVSKKIDDHSRTMLDSFIETTFDPIVNMDDSVLEGTDLAERKNMITSKDCRSIENYLFNDVIYFIVIKPGPYRLLKGKNTHLKPHKNTMPYLKQHGIASLRDHLTSAIHSLDKLKDDAERHTKAMEGYIAETVRILEEISKSSPKPDIAIEVTRELLENTKGYTKTLPTAFSLFERDIVIYGKVLDANVAYYKS